MQSTQRALSVFPRQPSPIETQLLRQLDFRKG